MYWKTWLQFVFPVYIWTLAIVIIIICRFSNKATRLFGDNSVHILATILLLSYTKVIRTIVTCLAFAPIEYPDGTKFVWLANGHLPYFGKRHSFLFIAGMIALFGFALPYTAIILMVPWLRKFSNYSWVNKFKPFFDAHYGPLKDKHHYWIGLTLLVRMILAVSEGGLEGVDPSINILTTLFLCILLGYLFHSAYKKFYLSVLDCFSLCNAAFLCGGFLFADTDGGKTVFTLVSVSICFVTFLVVVTVQIFTRIALVLNQFQRRRMQYTRIERQNEVAVNTRNPTTSYIKSLEEDCSYREPLLNSIQSSHCS